MFAGAKKIRGSGFFCTMEKKMRSNGHFLTLFVDMMLRKAE
jgi:hypothetical protein